VRLRKDRRRVLLGELPDRASVHLDRAYDSTTTRRKLATRCLVGEISLRRASRLRCKSENGGRLSARIPGTTPTRSFHEKAIPVKPTWRLWLSSKKCDVCALTRASIRTVVGSASC
jgi:hypothetical protein